ncbi:hypothetical protein L21SP2_2333 [Salinispira pacifica]|uniref:Uncharacterized protein n=1 Tax=Salinispira pacifica TaxID=1307761 RepID=V5WIR4_9SPIO|nr:hypothetical protein L21SP2_2333 [Salinispira pacifica]
MILPEQDRSPPSFPSPGSRGPVRRDPGLSGGIGGVPLPFGDAVPSIQGNCHFME